MTAILLTFQDGKLVGAIADGHVAIHVHNLDELEGAVAIEVPSIPRAELAQKIEDTKPALALLA